MFGSLKTQVSLALAKSNKALFNSGSGGATAQAISALQDAMSAMALEIELLKENSHKHTNETTLDALSTNAQGKLTLNGADV